MKYNRHTCPSKKEKIKDSLTVIILSSRIEYRKKTIGIQSFYKENKKEEYFLEKQINIIKGSFKNFETILCLGEDFEKNYNKVPDYIRVVENNDYNNSNTVEDLRISLNNTTTSRVLILHSGSLPSKNIGKINLNHSTIITNKELNDKFVGVNTYKYKVTTFNFALQDKWTGILYLTGKELSLVRDLCTKNNKKLILYEVLEKVIDKGGQIANIEDNETKLL